MHMSVKLKLTILFFSIATLPSLLIGVLTFSNYENSLKRDRISALQNIAAFKADEIRLYFSGLEANIKTFQDSYLLKKTLPVLNRLSGNTKDPEFIAAKKTLDERFKSAPSILALIDVMLVNADGKIIYSSNSKHYLKTLLTSLPDPQQKAFLEGKKGLSITDIFPDRDEDARDGMLISAPIIDFNGTFVGVIVFEVDMLPIYNILQDTVGLGNTGETYIGKKIDAKAIYLSPLKYVPETALEKKTIPLGDKIGIPMQNAVLGQSGSGYAIDYHGQKVVAAWKYIPSLKWGLVAKIDRREAFADVTYLRNFLMVILSLIFTMSGMTAFFIAKAISEARDNLNKEIAERQKKDEELCKYRDHLEGLILQKTEAIKDTEARYRYFVQEVPLFINHMGRDGKFMMWNKYSEELLGYTAEEAIGKLSPYDIHESRQDVAEIMRAVNAEGVYTKEVNFVHKNGKRFPVRLVVVPAKKDREGNITELYGFAEDIASRKHLEEQIKALSGLKMRLLESGELDKKLNLITDKVIEIFDADFARIWVVDKGDLCDKGCPHASVTEGPHVCRDRTRCLHLIASSGRYTRTDGSHRRVPLGCYKIGRVASGEDAYFITNDVTHDVRVHNPEWARSLGLASFAGYKITSPAGAPLGVLALFSKKPISASDEDLLKDVAGTASHVIFAEAAETDLRSSRRKLTEITNTIPGMVYEFTMDRTGKMEFVFASSAAKDLFGYPADDLVKDFSLAWNCVVPEDAEPLRQSIINSMTSQSPWVYEFRARIKDGSLRWIRGKSSIVRIDESGSFVWDGVLFDVTKDKEIEAALVASEANYRAIFESANDAIIIRDINTYQIIDANNKACEMFCYSKEELLTLGLGSLGAATAQYSTEKLKDIYDRAANGEPQLFEWLAKDKFGREFWIEINAKRAIIRGQYKLLYIARDITERKQALEIKDNFTNMVSHELRTPLGIIKEGVSLVLEGRAGAVNAKQKELLSVAKSSSDRLTRLISQVLDFQKIYAGKMEFKYEENQMNEAATEVYKGMISLAGKKGLKLILKLDHELPRVKFDKDKIMEVLTNLISNAIKFTDKGTITITTSHGENIIRVSIADTGCGIKEDDMSKLFHRFAQLQRKPGGTGLGLAISKEIIDAHRGKIWAESEVGKGATFHFILPIKERRR